jgi:hypothetical protein
MSGPRSISSNPTVAHDAGRFTGVEVRCQEIDLVMHQSASNMLMINSSFAFLGASKVCTAPQLMWESILQCYAKQKACKFVLQIILIPSTGCSISEVKHIALCLELAYN